ncbi:MAG: hypothetical protein Q8O37_03290 [Sulfuricellaceae bacterium]|nr:hypothetical protein [Sulfuricellaceae bacterium]
MNTRRSQVLLAFSLMLSTGLWAGGPWHAAGQNTAGWQFMTPNERVDHQRRMRSFDRYEDCRAYQAEHHALMAERAQKAGVTLEQREHSGCEQLRNRGKLQ